MHEVYMRRCLDLALLGAGHVSPNPMVGALLVCEGRIIGEGWHQRWGGPHAEVNCVGSVKQEDRHLIPLSSLYCTLEPCFHYGKTPPCVDLILKEGISKVVIANEDPNPKVAGQSVQKMRAAGILVETGVLAQEAAFLNRAFFHSIRYKKPYVVLKWAQSADGFLGRKGERTAISGPWTQRLVHRWRSELDAILAGTQTVLTDNPKLDARLHGGRNPLRITFDIEKKIPAEYNILDDSTPTWVFGPMHDGSYQQTEFIPSDHPVSLEALLNRLYENNRATLLVEGGAQVLAAFLDSGLWNEIRLIVGSKSLGGGVKAPQLPEGLVLHEHFQVDQDNIRIFLKRELT